MKTLYTLRDVWFNVNDPDLKSFKIDLYDDVIRPVWSKYGVEFKELYDDNVRNIGEKRHKQKIVRDEIPPRLQTIVDNIMNRPRRKTETPISRLLESIDLFWTELLKPNYKDEIEFIRQQWKSRILGQWYMVDGNPVYITGDHWMYINHWRLKGGIRPEYRDRDRRWYYGLTYAEHTTKTVVYEDGEYKHKDVGYRTAYGISVVKCRRAGDTSKAQCAGYNRVTLATNVIGAVQADGGDKSDKIFNDNFVEPITSMPLWFMPNRDQFMPSTEVSFNYGDRDSLYSKYMFAESKDRQKLDGLKLAFFAGDESGKIKGEDINLINEVTKQCLSSGINITGVNIYTTTVEELERGGLEFKHFCNNSMWHNRDKNGRTSSGVILLFFPATDCLEGFVDAFGNSVDETPTKEQQEFIKKDFGSIEFVENQLMEKLKNEDLVGYANLLRMYPRKFRDAFTPPPENTFFNIKKVGERYTELLANTGKYTRTGVLEWNEDNRTVRFIDNNQGHWVISYKFEDSEINRKRFYNGSYEPDNGNKFVVSADVFKNNKTNYSKKSSGGIAVRLLRDPYIDTDDKPVEEWTTSRLVMTYSHRPPTTDEFCDEVLKACVYSGGYCYPENNLDLVQVYFERKGYTGYLMFDVDPMTNKKKPKAGFHSGSNSKDEIFNLTKDDIERHVHRNCHADYLLEVLEIKGTADMTHYDLFTAVGGTILAEKKKRVYEIPEEVEADSVIDDSFWGETEY